MAGARDAVKVTDWRFKTSVMISSGEDYIRRVCRVDGWWVSLVCVCVEREEGTFKGDRDGCMHVYLYTDVYMSVCTLVYVCLSV